MVPSGFSNILKGKVVIIGVGHVLKGDDAIGPEIIQGLQGTITAVCVDAGTSPENYLGKIMREKPQTILFIDAADLGQSPGACEILKGEEVLRSGLTTHDMSPRMFMDLLREETGADIYLLAIQPQHVKLGEEVSPAVRRTGEEIVKIIQEILYA